MNAGRAVFGRLAALEAPILALVVVAAIAVERLLPVALVVAALFWPVRWLANRRLSVRTAADWPIGVLIALLPVTLWATALPAVTRVQVFRLLVGIALCYALVNWASTLARLRLAMNGLLAAGLGLALLAPFMGGLPATSKLSFIPALAARLPQLPAETVNANVVACALAPVWPLVLALALQGHLHWAERLLAGVATLLIGGVTVLTQSRGSMMALAAAGLLVIALRWRRGWLALPAVALAGGLARGRSAAARSAGHVADPWRPGAAH